jgi:beta-galactosidase
MDYLGEAGLAHSIPSNAKNSFFMPWPWIGAWCGDLDLCGFKKPQSLYRDVVWRRSPIEMVVHDPVPEGLHETISRWGWPGESQNWNWPGQEGRAMQVSVFSRCDTVRLELNGKVVGTAPVSEATKLTARFDVPYAPGELRAYGLINGKVAARTTLRTTGAPKKLRLIPDRAVIRGDRNDLSYVTVEVVDENGLRVPNAEIPVTLSVTGVGELAAQGSGTPNDPASFRTPLRKTFRGRCLAILRPTGGAGEIRLKASAEGMDPEMLTVRCGENGGNP